VFGIGAFHGIDAFNYISVVSTDGVGRTDIGVFLIGVVNADVRDSIPEAAQPRSDGIAVVDGGGQRRKGSVIERGDGDDDGASHTQRRRCRRRQASLFSAFAFVIAIADADADADTNYATTRARCHTYVTLRVAKSHETTAIYKFDYRENNRMKDVV
jgi:hypothetical protein